MSYTPLLWLLALGGLTWLYRATLVDRPRVLLISSLAARGLVVVLLALALSRPYLRQAGDKLHVAFLVDVSQSVALADARHGLEQVDHAINKLRPGDSWSLFALGRDLRPIADTAAFRDLLEGWENGGADERFRSATRLGAALSAVRLSLPAGKVHRVVVFSDGRPTDEHLSATLRQLEAERVTLRFAPLAGLQDPEAAIVALDPARPTAFQQEVVRLTARLVTNTAMPARINLVQRGVIVATQEVRLDPDGETRVAFDMPMEIAGPTVWTAQIVPAADRFAVNNSAATVITVRGDARVLAIHSRTRELRPFARALQAQGFSLDVRPPRGLPQDLSEMLAFDAVVLADVPATELTSRQMSLLQRYVRDFGGGLLMMGSENSFGLGGYYKTPVEQVLPLTSRFEKEKQKPSMAMTLVIDKSGSMSGLPIALARQAAKATVELLAPRDQIGVTAFDSTAYVVSPMRFGTDAENIKAAIERVGAGGGTFLFAGMHAARELLDGVPAKIKHMIVLSDGQTQPADHETLVQQLVEMGVTVSTVALGGGADRALLARLAKMGQGRYYETLDPSTVPQIFTRETVQASRSAIKEDLFAAVAVQDHPLLAGYQRTRLPFTLGYVMTQARPTAQVVLATDTGDPLLAVGRFGLGVGMAFTSDMTERWGGEWLAWPDCGPFWSQVLRYLARKPATAGLTVESGTDAVDWVVDVSVRDDREALQPGVKWDALAVDDFGQTVTPEVQTVGLGRYRFRVPTADRQHLTLRLHAPELDRTHVVHHLRSYPAEYRLDRAVDPRVAGLTPFDATGADTERVTVTERVALAPPLVISAIALLLISVLLRRV